MINYISRSFLIVTIFVLVSIHVSQAADLFHAEVNIRAKEGKDLIMTLDEVERREKFSIIKVKYISGASVPSSMFVVKGCY